MAEKKRERSWKHGWPTAIAVVSVVVAGGFAIGVIAGIFDDRRPRLAVLKR